MKIFSIIFFTENLLPIGFTFHISQLLQDNNDTMLVPGMNVCMSASNKGNLRFCTSLYFAERNVYFQEDEFFPSVSGSFGTTLPSRFVFSYKISGNFSTGLKNFVLAH